MNQNKLWMFTDVLGVYLDTTRINFHKIRIYLGLCRDVCVAISVHIGINETCDGRGLVHLFTVAQIEGYKEYKPGRAGIISDHFSFS